MTTPWRVALGAVLGGLLAVAGWRILAHGVADARVGEDPAGALHWVSGHPEALRTLAEQQFDAGQTLLSHVPQRLVVRAQQAVLDGMAELTAQAAHAT